MHNERKRQNPVKYVFRCALFRVLISRLSSVVCGLYDVLELASSNVELGANMIHARICGLCSLGFSGNTEHTLNSVDEENGDEYETDFKSVCNFSNNIGLV